MKNVFVVAVTAVLLSACDGKDSKKDSKQPTVTDTDTDTADLGVTESPDAEKAKAPKKISPTKKPVTKKKTITTATKEEVGDAAAVVKAYEPRVGDFVTTTDSQKQWLAGTEEPEYGAAAEASQKVTGLYNENGNHCRYRVATLRAGAEVSYDVGCDQLQCGSAPVLCETSEIDDADVGSFKDADGQRTTCVSVVGAVAIKTITDTYTHDDVLREGRAAKIETSSCSAAADKFAGEVSLAWKVCEEGESFTKNLSIVSDQKAGEEDVYLPFAPEASFKLAGAVSEPEKSVTNASCMIVADVLTISLTKSYCNQDDVAQMYSFTLSQLPTASQAGFKSKAYGAMLFDQALSASYMAAEEGACEISYEVGDGFLEGSAACSGALPLPADATKKAEISEVRFACGI